MLADIMMPVLDGYHVLKKLRAAGNLPVIVISAKKQDPERILGLDLGADDYLVKPFNPLEAVARVRSVLRRAEVPEEPVTVYADDVQLGRVVANLIGNTARHNAPGTTIVVGLHRRAGVADVIVADDGAAISSTAEQLFEPFTREDAARADGGSGLGLSIAKTIVDLHGYQIRLVQPYGAFTKAFVVTCATES